MRDPARIEEMLNLVRKIWEHEPDLRLGQIVDNAASFAEQTIHDLFLIEDDILKKGLVRYLEMVEEHPKDGAEIVIAKNENANHGSPSIKRT